ncbi:HP0495 family protein [Kushneria sp. EE4]
MSRPSSQKPAAILSSPGDDKKTQEAPKIEFPCDYGIKIVGNNDVEFDRDMLDIVERFSPELDRSRVTHRDSRNGKYRSLHVTIYATGEEQLNELFVALKATGRVQMVL